MFNFEFNFQLILFSLIKMIIKCYSSDLYIFKT